MTKSTGVRAVRYTTQRWKERRKDVVKLRRAGWSFKEIGEKLGFSQQRAHAIHKSMTTVTIPKSRLRKPRAPKMPVAAETDFEKFV